MKIAHTHPYSGSTLGAISNTGRSKLPALVPNGTTAMSSEKHHQNRHHSAQQQLCTLCYSTPKAAPELMQIETIG